MDKTILKKFAIESRKDLMEKIDRKIKLFYIDEELKKDNRGDIVVLSNDKHSLTLTKDEDSNRDKLLRRIVELGYNQVVEEAAYTWFNRIVAIRYMELNDFLPLSHDNRSLGIRVLSDLDDKPIPEILKFSNLSRTDLDINFDKNKYMSYEKEDDKYKYILKLICKKIGKVIPQVFDGITDYIDLLIPDNMLQENGFVYKLVSEIPKNNFAEVEIIGWLYQYYNQEEKDRVMSQKKAYKKNEIPYATELFTPDWIVKYMVENSLGRYAIEHGASSTLSNNWEYYIDSDYNVLEKIDPLDIKFLDPCCGSGHILVYAFELLVQIYESYGYPKKDIPMLILKNNLFGLDIDDRAGQLSVLSLLLKAREYDKDLFNKSIVENMNVLSLQEPGNISFEIYDNDLLSQSDISYLLRTFKDAKEIGSLLKVEKQDYSLTLNKLKNNIFDYILGEQLKPLIKQATIMSEKYDVVVTNPPYMSNGVMGNTLKDYLSTHYKDSKMDLCCAFMEANYAKPSGYYAMINQHSWMYLFSFENLRKQIISNKTITNMVHLGTRAFEEIGGEVVQTTTFVMKNESNNDYVTKFIELNNIDNALEKENIFKKSLHNGDRTYYHNLKEFLDIPGFVFTFQADNKTIKLFENKKLGDVIEVATGLSTSDNNRFLRLWHEVDYNNIEFKGNIESDKKWFPMAKGGSFRKWYGNLDYLINWQYDGKEIKSYAESLYKCSSRTIKNTKHYFKEGLTWSALTTGNLSMRYMKNSIFGSGASCAFTNSNLYNLMGFMNSELVNYFMNLLNPTLNVNVTDMVKIPYLDIDNPIIEKTVLDCIDIAKKDWNNKETSYEFKKPNFITSEIKELDKVVEKSINDSIINHDNIKQKEEELNKLFIEQYGLKDVVDYKIEEKYISCSIEKENEIVKKIISYAVGCMFGRFSIDTDGIVCASNQYDSKVYSSFAPDSDNVIPISDDESVYYNDDIVGKFKDFIKVVYGEEELNANIDYIASVLGKKGTESSDDTIRRYFVNDFFNDHLKMYQKRPIYWLFDSGKKNGFKCLVYLHRYDEQIVSKIRTKYLHNTISIYQRTVEEIDYKLNNSDLNTVDKRNLQNKLSELNMKITECNEYEEKVGNVANKMIKLDLDDGVAVNYSKFIDDNGKSILANIK